MESYSQKHGHVQSHWSKELLKKKIFNNKILCTSCLDSRDVWSYFFFKISVTYYGAVPHIVFQHKDF